MSEKDKELENLEVTELSEGDLEDVAGGAAGNSGCNCGCPCSPKEPELPVE